MEEEYYNDIPFEDVPDEVWAEWADEYLAEEEYWKQVNAELYFEMQNEIN